jgi:LCP family protein required for cell wall assembly
MAGSARRFPALRHGVYALITLSAWIAGATLGIIPPASQGTQAEKEHPQFILRAAHPKAPVGGNGPIFILAIGSDSRPRTPIDRGHSDVLQLIGVSQQKNKASILGFNRDYEVPIPGVGVDKINEAMSTGGPDLTVATVEALSGIHIDYYLITSFGGLKTMIDKVGGLTIEVPYPIYDPHSGAAIDPGFQHLDGTQTLAMARARHNVPGSVYGRTKNQQRILLATLRQLQEDYAADQGNLNTYIDAISDSTTSTVSMSDLSALADLALKVPNKNVKSVLLPGKSARIGHRTLAFLDRKGANRIFRDVRTDGLIGG